MRMIFLLPVAPLLLLAPSDAARGQEAIRGAGTSTIGSADVPSLPESHPAHGLEPSEFTIRDGVIVEQFPDGSREQTLIAGIPIAQQPPSIPGVARDRGVDDADLATQQQAFTRWAAAYDGRHLDPTKQQALLDLYHDFGGRTASIENSYAAGDIDMERMLRSTSEIIADFILQRDNIFAGAPSRAFDLPAVDQDRLENYIYEFISGGYLQHEQAEAPVRLELVQ